MTKIVYRLNVGRTDGEVIPFGILIEFKNDGNSVMLVLAVRELLAEEREKLDFGAQQLLASTVTYLNNEIDVAVAACVPDLLAHLGEKFMYAIQFEAPVDVPVPADFAARLSAAFEMPAPRGTGALASPATVGGLGRLRRPARPVTRDIVVGDVVHYDDSEAAMAFVTAAAPEFRPETTSLKIEPWIIAQANKTGYFDPRH